MNKVDSIYSSVPRFRLTLLDLAFRVLFQGFQTRVNRIKIEVSVATGTNKQMQSNRAVFTVNIRPKPRSFKVVFMRSIWNKQGRVLQISIKATVETLKVHLTPVFFRWNDFPVLRRNLENSSKAQPFCFAIEFEENRSSDCCDVYPGGLDISSPLISLRMVQYTFEKCAETPSRGAIGCCGNIPDLKIDILYNLLATIG